MGEGVTTWQWLSLLLILLAHTGALFRWGGRVGLKLEQHDKVHGEIKEDVRVKHGEIKEDVRLLRETDASQGQVMAVATRLLDVHAEEIQRLRDWKHDDYQQWAQRIEARVATLELDRVKHGERKQ